MNNSILNISKKGDSIDDETSLQKTINSLKLENDRIKKELKILEVQKKSFAEVAFQYGKELGKSIGEVKFLEMIKELSVVRGLHNPIHESNVENMEGLEDEITEYLSNKKYEFQNEFLPLFLSGKITLIGNKDYLYWFEAVDDWLEYAKKGNKDAQKNLIICFENGYGVEKNNQMAEFWKKKLNNEIVEEPVFEEFFEFKKPERLIEENETSQIFNVDPSNIVKNFYETKECEELINSINEIYKDASSIQSIYIKKPKSIEKLLELEKKYEYLPYETKNELFGSILIIHTSQFEMLVDNIKEVGSFIKKEKRADVQIKISNNSNWTCSFAISAEDNLGNVSHSKCKINPHSSSQINIFNQHLVGTKINKILFKTLDKDSRTFSFIPKNWIVK